MNSPYTVIVSIVLVVMLLVGIGFVGYRQAQAPVPEKQDSPVAQNKTFRLKIGESATIFGGTAKVTDVLEDSRCPESAECVWTGTVKVRIHATYGLFSKDIVLEQGVPFSVGEHSVTLTEVDPVRKTESPPALREYVFTFNGL
jgi:hypothetical protein